MIQVSCQRCSKDVRIRGELRTL